MRSFAMKLVWFTTFYLVVFTILTQLDTPIELLIGMLVVGQALVILMVYKVLTGNYTTHKTFKDWYEDKAVETLDE